MTLNTTEKLNKPFLIEFLDAGEIPKESVLNDIVTYFGELEDSLIEQIKGGLENYLRTAITQSQQAISLEASRFKINKCTGDLNNLLRAIDSIIEQILYNRL
jgi:glutamate formiminotransferase